MLKPRVEQKTIDKMRKLSNEGFTKMQIANKLNISFWVVKYHLDPRYKEQVKASNIKRWDKVRREKDGK